MHPLSRRDVPASLALAGASSVARGSGRIPLPLASDAAPWLQLFPAERKGAADTLLEYFRGGAPKLLRPAEGILRYPRISPSLPGKAYSTSLWDWDTYWTARGLFRLAAYRAAGSCMGKFANMPKAFS